MLEWNKTMLKIKASNEKLLTATSKFLIEHRYDLPSLMRVILQSATYQRSSQSIPGNEGDGRFYSRYYPKRLMAEVLLDAMSQVTDSATQFSAESRPGQKSENDFPLGYRALQLPDTFVHSYFLKSFGRPDRSQTCECERTTEPSVAQVLHISNGDTLNQKLAAKGNRIEKLLEAKMPPSGVVEEACLLAFSRYPKPEETQKLSAVLADAWKSDQRAAVEDLFWALLSSKEFLFNH